MDQVYTAGMDGRLCAGDGRSREDESKQYGSAGTLTGKKYMLSITYNAPREAFDDPDQAFFGGRGVDDLFWPMHLNFKFFGMTPPKRLPATMYSRIRMSITTLSGSKLTWTGYSRPSVNHRVQIKF